MKSLFLALGLISSFALAETAKIGVEGMHCSGCKEVVAKKVCENEAIKKNSESCSVKLTDEAKQMGEITIVSKGDSKVDIEAVKTQLATSGEDYKVATVDVRAYNFKDGSKMTDEQATEIAKPTPNSKMVTTTTTTETETTDADGKTTVEKEVKVKKIKTASKTTTTKKATK